MDHPVMFLAHGLMVTFVLGALGLLFWAFIERRRPKGAGRAHRRPVARR